MSGSGLNVREPSLEELRWREAQINSLSNGVFQDWNRAPIGWLVGGGTLLALVDWWIRAFTIGS